MTLATTKNVDDIENQSKLQTGRKERENARERVLIGFGFSCDWMKNWREVLSQSIFVVT